MSKTLLKQLKAEDKHIVNSALGSNNTEIYHISPENAMRKLVKRESSRATTPQSSQASTIGTISSDNDLPLLPNGKLPEMIFFNNNNTNNNNNNNSCSN
jgi:hypothetical protein